MLNDRSMTLALERDFTLSKNFDDMFNWANCTTAKPTILIFKANCCFLDSARKLDLFDNEKQWHEIVLAFRLGKANGKNMNIQMA